MPTPNTDKGNLKEQVNLSQIPEEPKKKKRQHHKKGDDSSESSEESEEETTKKKAPLIIKDLIAENFVMLTLIGKGAFGQILLSFNMRDNIEVAIKKEMKRPQKAPQLRTEAKIYQSLLSIAPQDISGVKALAQEDVQGVPRFYGMGELIDSYYLIMEFLGPNLIELLNYCNTRKFTISTVCLIALQILNRFENLYKPHFIHRDNKPENFLIGTQDKSNIIYLIDFGLSKRYKNPKNHQHIPYREGRPLTGTARYVSINTHLGIEQSRRDDLESIGYVLIFFLKGSLPWQGLKTGVDKYQRIMEKKLQIPTEILCYGLPDEIIYYLNYCKSLRFEDRPDYDYLRGLFIKLLGSCNTIYGLTKDMLKFDWCFDDPKNSIWLIFNKNKKGGGFTSASYNKQSDSFIKEKENNINGSGIHVINTPPITSSNSKINSNNEHLANNKMGPKQLSNIDEGANYSKTNENNPQAYSDVDNSSSSQIDTKNKKSQVGSESSDETIKQEFQGLSNLPENNILIDTELNNIVLKGQNIEDIDKYINKLLQSSKFVKNIKQETKEQSQKEDKEKKEEKEVKKANNSSEKEDVDISQNPVIGGRNKSKLKDSLDINSPEKPKKHQNPQVAKSYREEIPMNSEEKITKLLNKKDKELIKNTMRNSKILAPEDLANIQNYKKPEPKQRKSKIVFKEVEEEENAKNNVNDTQNNTLNIKEEEEITKSKKNINIEEKKDKKSKSSGSSNSSVKSNNNDTNKKGANFPTNKSNPTPTSKNQKKVLSEKDLINLPPIKISESGRNQSQGGEPSKREGGKSFEAEIIPKMSNPEIKERRKSKILEMGIFPNFSDMKVSKENMIKIMNEPIAKYYVILGNLGHGSYGQVKRVKNIKMNEERAMKIVKKKSESSHNEVEILKKISHPNIANVFEIFEDSRKYYIMMELLEGGELFEVIINQGYFSEADAAKIMKQLLSAVNYLHSKNIVHRDLKPENIMLTKKPVKNKFEIKIIDFGTAKIFDPKKRMTKFIGTSYYIAPEVLKENYDEKCDVWSCGVILYILLCGYPPFNGNSNVDIFHHIQNAQPMFTGEEWQGITKEAIDLLKSMLNKNPSKRFSTEKCLAHKWFQLMEDAEKSNNKNYKTIQMNAINKMSQFVKENRLKKAVLQFISTQFNLKSEEDELRDLFKELDTNNKGQISKVAFGDHLISLYGEKEGKDLCNKIFEDLDLDGSGEISYDEFLSAMIDTKKIITEDKLAKAFKVFDKDNNGRLSVDEIREVFGGDIKTWKKVIEDIDLNKDGEVDFKEFKAMMMNIDKKIVFGDESKIPKIAKSNC